MFEEVVTVRLTRPQAAKLRHIETHTRRTRSAILRMLLEQAVVAPTPDVQLDTKRGLYERTA